MKKRVSIYLVILFALVMQFSLRAEGDIKININGQNVYGDASPIVVNERTLVPVRLVSENLGLAVDWNQDLQEVTLTNEATIIKFIIGTTTYNKNGIDIPMDIAPVVYMERTYLPIRVIGECLDKKVDWDQATKTVLIMDAANEFTNGTYNLTSDASKADPKKYNPDNGDLLSYLKADGRIIGNRKSLIYHVPGGASYDKVSLKNAVFFNTEEEAINAGYRKAKN